MTLLHRNVATAVLLASATFVGAATRPPTTKISDTTLPNGLRVLIVEDHVAPVFSIVVNYNVGSRNERQGRTGFAHLSEHMMLKRSENVGQNEHPYPMFMHGGSMNRPTNNERTLYYETLPATH